MELKRVGDLMVSSVSQRQAVQDGIGRHLPVMERN